MQQDILDKAQKIIDETGNYSISHMQRKLGIGYNTASAIIQDIKQKLLSNETKLYEKMRYFLHFFTKEELLPCLKDIYFMTENELKFSLNGDFFNISIFDDKLSISHITFVEQEIEIDGFKMMNDKEVKTNISKDTFLKILSFIKKDDIL